MKRTIQVEIRADTTGLQLQLARLEAMALRVELACVRAELRSALDREQRLLAGVRPGDEC